jgi:hypothetical protein
MLDDIGMEAFAERARWELLATGETARKRDRRPRPVASPPGALEELPALKGAELGTSDWTRSPRTGSTCSPTPPTTTSGSILTSGAPRPSRDRCLGPPSGNEVPSSTTSIAPNTLHNTEVTPAQEAHLQECTPLYTEPSTEARLTAPSCSVRHPEGLSRGKLGSCVRARWAAGSVGYRRPSE